MKVFLDTSFLVAYYNLDDSNHPVAINAYHEIKRIASESPLIITDYIFDELTTLLLSRADKYTAVNICRKILADPFVLMIPMTIELFRKSWKIFSSMEDKSWSFTDCSSYVVMQEFGIRHAASFDAHFRQFGFTILP